MSLKAWYYDQIGVHKHTFVHLGDKRCDFGEYGIRWFSIYKCQHCPKTLHGLSDEDLQHLPLSMQYNLTQRVPSSFERNVRVFLFFLLGSFIGVFIRWFITGVISFNFTVGVIFGYWTSEVLWWIGKALWRRHKLHHVVHPL